MPLPLARRRLIPALALCLLGCSAQAAEGVLSEVRGGVLAHDVGVFGSSKEEGVDIDGEVLFAAPPALAALGSPRPHLGLSVNTAGDTSLAYAGLTWTIDLSRAVFLDLSLGGAVHNGGLSGGAGEKALGCRALFRESASLGYRLSERHDVSLLLAHASNLDLCDRNEGIDMLGVRFGYRF